MQKINKEFNQELHDLSYQMMLLEHQKNQEENMKYFKEKNNKTPYRLIEEEKGYYRRLITLDLKGYELSLKYNDRMHDLGFDHNALEFGPDVVNESAILLLNKYGLEYPISWRIKEETPEELIFEYYNSSKIDNQNYEYEQKVKDLRSQSKINEQEEERLLLAGEYFKAHHKILSYYHNHEVVTEEDLKIGSSRQR